ncbi:MAG: hypothetical protein R3E54_09350 [Halioglobus sp.]
MALLGIWRRRDLLADISPWRSPTISLRQADGVTGETRSPKTAWRRAWGWISSGSCGFAPHARPPTGGLTPAQDFM